MPYAWHDLAPARRGSLGTLGAKLSLHMVKNDATSGAPASNAPENVRGRVKLSAFIGVPLYLRGKDTLAVGAISATGFIVRADSQIAPETTASFDKSRGLSDLRERLLREGVLTRSAGVYHFKSDCEFGSASTAASIIRGCPANGYATWRTEDGVKLGDLLDATP